MRVLRTTVTAVRLAALLLLAWLSACRDLPRDNPYDPLTEVLTVTVDAPADSSVFRQGQPVTFRVSAATAFDDQGVALRSAVWRSSLAGPLSDSLTFSRSDLPAGTHRITVTVQDSSGRSGAETFSLIILPAPAFGVVIDFPPADTAVILGASFHPVVEEFLPADGTVEGRLWSFGPGSGLADFQGQDPGTVTWRQPGVFEMVYQIVDNRGRLAADTVQVEVVQNATPTYVAIISPAADTTVDVGDSLFFEALEIETSAKVSSRAWVWPAGSGLNNGHDRVAVAGWRRFARPGTYEIIYGVRDKLGLSSADTVTVSVVDTIAAPQTAILSPSRDTTVARGAPVNFRASDSDPWGGIVRRVWSWGEGSGLDSTGDVTATPGEKVFMEVGVFTVRYTVSRANGVQASASVQVTVTPNQLPTAHINTLSGDTTITSGERLPVGGNASDADGNITRREWTLRHPDGSLETLDVSSPPLWLRITAAGAYRLYFRVTDNSGARSADSLNINVLAGSPNQMPLAYIITPTRDTTAGAWVNLNFLAQDSDPDGAIVSRKWTFGNAVAAAPSDTSAAAGKRAFTIDGTYPVVYSVMDNRGAVKADTLIITVLTNNRPNAEILSPMTGEVFARNDTVTVIGLDSDPGGRIVSRAWNYGAGSGIAADTISVPGYRYYHNAGTFLITYTVTDDMGAQRADTVSVTIRP
ncbi:hypothetical protein LLH00_09550 [bacterium]|nr:hypothetical protein [bacterium]